MFGFLLLLLKKDKLSAYRGVNGIQRSVGIIFALSSFIAYYSLVFLFSVFPVYTGGTSYIAYIFGLFLALFDFSALKEALTPMFITAAATSLAYVNLMLELSISSYVIPPFTSLIGLVSNSLGVAVTVQHPDLMTLHALRGSIPLRVIWGCIGAYGALLFSILMIVVFAEEPVSLKTKMLWAVVGIIGVLVLNTLRVVIILVIGYYYDINFAETAVHPYLGYALFLMWLMVFLSIFSNRESLLKKLALTKPRNH